LKAKRTPHFSHQVAATVGFTIGYAGDEDSRPQPRNPYMDIHEVGISMADSTKFGADHRAQAGNGRRDFDD